VSILLDTGPILSLADTSDDHHAAVKAAWEASQDTFVTSQAVITEASYLLSKYLGPDAELRLLAAWQAGDFRVEPIADDDLRRVLEILRAYRDQRFGFTDAGLFTLAERFKIRRVMTLDRRHFDAYRPAHCPTWEHVVEA